MFATVNGTEIFYTIAGTGLPCLVPSLAGTPIYERTFSSPALRERLQMIFVELRANRTAVGDLDTLTLHSLVDDLDTFRRALGFERVAVLGHSGHSILAFAYAARYPQNVSRIIIVGGTPRFSDEMNTRAAQYWTLVASPVRKGILVEKQALLTDEAMRRLTPSEQIIALYVAGGAKFFAAPRYDCTPLWEGHTDLSPALMQRFWGPHGQFSTFDPDAHFPAITCPVFIAQGVFDFGCPPVYWIGYHEKLPSPTYHTFEHSGHYPNMEEPEVFDAALLAWLDRAP